MRVEDLDIDGQRGGHGGAGEHPGGLLFELLLPARNLRRRQAELDGQRRQRLPLLQGGQRHLGFELRREPATIAFCVHCSNLADP